MSVGKLAPASRGMLRLHGWLLMLWVAGVGLVTSALLLHVFHVHAMAVRYAAGAAAVYFLGFIFGGWWYARWWNARKALPQPELPERATAQEQEAYDAEVKAQGKKMEGLDFLDGWGGGDDPISAILTVIAVIFLVFALFYIAGALPMIVTDSIAGYLAEIVIEFVIGAAAYRRILRPRPLSGFFSFALGSTWLAGLLMVVVFGAIGFGLQQYNPAARTLLQAFR